MRFIKMGNYVRIRQESSADYVNVHQNIRLQKVRKTWIHSPSVSDNVGEICTFCEHYCYMEISGGFCIYGVR